MLAAGKSQEKWGGCKFARSPLMKKMRRSRRSWLLFSLDGLVGFLVFFQNPTKKMNQRGKEHSLALAGSN